VSDININFVLLANFSKTSQYQISRKSVISPPNGQLVFNVLYGVISQKKGPFIIIALRISHPTQSNPIHTLIPQYSMIHINVTVYPTTRSSRWIISLMFSV
jgi:hypothetical protein